MPAQMHATAEKLKAKRMNWRGRHQAAWRDLLSPVKVAKIIGEKPPTLVQIFSEDLEGLIKLVPPRNRRRFRAALVKLLDKTYSYAISATHDGK